MKVDRAAIRLLPAPAESAHAKAQRLMTEARSAADEHVVVLIQLLGRVAEVASDVGRGGDVYPPGVRELAAKIGDDGAWCGQTIQTVMRSVGRISAPV